MTARRARTIRPFTASGRRAIGGILLIFGLFSTMSVALSIRATERSRNQAAVVQVGARQRTLAERYVDEVLLARMGLKSDPAYFAGALKDSADALLDGGTAPPVNGDDDDVALGRATDPAIRAQLSQARRLVADLTATGSALLGGHSVEAVPLTASEHLTVSDPILRLRVLAALTSNVSLNTSRAIADATDHNISGLIGLQIGLGIAGALASVILGWALIAAARRQTAHFRSLVTHSTDLVLVFGPGGCRYASESVATLVGKPEADIVGSGFLQCVHPDDRARVESVSLSAEPHSIEFVLAGRFGEWRHVEAHVTDLRNDRHLRGVVLNARDITERVRLEEELTHQAFHDVLTGLANRALFHDRLDQVLARSVRSQDSLAVLLLDLDRFKQVNDSLGHGSGDDLLRQLSQRLSEVTRPSDTLARLGGDEFAVVLDGASEAEAVAITERLLERLREPMTVAGRELILDASIGIALQCGAGVTGEELTRRADVAMYTAKRDGGAQFVVFHPDMAADASELLELEHDMRQGLQRGEFTVYYQPEIDIDSDTIVGVEALVRWNSPARGLVMPDQFIPIAEATGLIVPLGEIVLTEACQQAAVWRDNSLIPEPFVTWVNLSGKQLSTGGIDVLVRRVLEETGLPARYLGLEVTETAIVIEGPTGDRARSELDDIHDLGVRIAIDDFGTGFSSLAQLRRFPIDVIKVDRSFIQGIGHDAKSATITANLASLAHALGLVAIAEGVETQGQFSSARDLGCDLAQGYLFARPAPADQVTELLMRRGANARPAASARGAAAATSSPNR